MVEHSLIPRPYHSAFQCCNVERIGEPRDEARPSIPTNCLLIVQPSSDVAVGIHTSQQLV